jgi:hypothetical protein
VRAVVSFFDNKNKRLVRSLWKEPEDTFHLHGVYRTPYPHFSYQISLYYDILINQQKDIVFQYGMTNVTGSGFDQLYEPYTAFVIGDYTGQTPPPPSFYP